MSENYTISDLAAEFGVTTRTIRHYEDEGLLTPQREGTTRCFSRRDRVRLKLALRGKRLGLTLGEIRELFDLYDVARDEKKQVEAFLATLNRHRAQLEQRREDILAMLDEITFFENECQKLLKKASSAQDSGNQKPVEANSA